MFEITRKLKPDGTACNILIDESCCGYLISCNAKRRVEYCWFKLVVICGFLNCVAANFEIGLICGVREMSFVVKLVSILNFLLYGRTDI